MGIDVKVVPATAELADGFVPLMRNADVAEVLALGYESPRAAVFHSLASSSIAFALLFDGEVAVLFGVTEPVPGPSDVPMGCVWALTGRAVAKHPKAFLRSSKPALSVLLSHCSLLWNWVDVRYLGAVRWLRWLGFTVGEAKPVGPSGQMFHPISIWRSPWAR